MSATNKDTTTSTPQFLSALVTGAAVVGALSAVFFLLYRNPKLQRVYQARHELAPDEKRPAALPRGIVPWWKTILTSPDKLIIEQNGLDAYFFLRFIKIFGLFLLVPYFLLTWIVLMPVSATKPNNGLSGLNRFTFGNVGPNVQQRHVAHFLIAVLLILWTIYIIFREYQHFLVTRQSWLTSSTHQRLARARTVMLVNVPKDLMSGSTLRELAGSITHSAAPVKVWLSREAKKIEDVYDERTKEHARLEAGEGKMLMQAVKNVKKKKVPSSTSSSDPERTTTSADALIEKYLTPKQRSKVTWKQGFLGLIGRKMDREQSPAFIREKNEELERMRGDLDQFELGNVAFLRFKSQAEAHTFARCVNKDRERKLIKSGIEVVPEDIEWNNTSKNPYQRKIGGIISWALTIGLIIVWSIPVSFVGGVSNVDALCTTASWLAWICTIPKVALGIIKGVLPPVLLAILFALLPIVLRLWIKMSGVVRKSDIELKLFSRFWLFQVIHGFLIITLSSGLMAALGNWDEFINDVPTMLADKLPSASIFFLTFIITATFSSAAQAYSRVVPVALFFLKNILGGNTPRKVYLSEFKMQSFAWATVWPPVCLIVCITIVYSVIQPIICGLALVAFALMYSAYKYLLGWCADQPDALETGGMYYPKALNTVFVALYLEEVCLAGLLFLSSDPNGKRSKSGLAGGVIMVVTGIFTIAAHIYMKRRFNSETVTYTHASLIGGTASSTKLNQTTTTGTEGGYGQRSDALVHDDDSSDAGEQYGNTTGMHAHAFDHPAFWKRQPIVWMADDELGIARKEVERLNDEHGVEASTQYAHLDAEGNLTVERAPPDDEFYGGMSQH
ncbi:phosphate metabolism protein 7 [Naganishia albida]|nr:phosphate metabolism protein 7 [Naganishia albida]